MAFFSSAITTLKTLVVAIGAGLGVWGVVNLLEGYGNDNPGAKSQGIKMCIRDRDYSRDLRIYVQIGLSERGKASDSIMG